MQLLKEKTNELESLHKKMLILQSTELLLKNANDQNLYLSKELENKKNHLEKLIYLIFAKNLFIFFVFNSLSVSVDNMKTDLLTSTKVGTNKEKKLHDKIITLKKQTTVLESSINDQEETVVSKFYSNFLIFLIF